MNTPKIHEVFSLDSEALLTDSCPKRSLRAKNIPPVIPSVSAFAMQGYEKDRDGPEHIGTILKRVLEGLEKSIVVGKAAGRIAPNPRPCPSGPAHLLIESEEKRMVSLDDHSRESEEEVLEAIQYHQESVVEVMKIREEYPKKA